MATYVPNATDSAQPTEDKQVVSAALEFRTLKTSVNSNISGLQTTAAGLDTRVGAIETTFSSLGAGGQAGIVYIQQFSGTGAQVSFTMAIAPASTSVVDIYVNGLYQQKAAFSVHDTTLTFSVPPPAGTNNIEAKIYVTTAAVAAFTDIDHQVELAQDAASDAHDSALSAFDNAELVSGYLTTMSPVIVSIDTILDVQSNLTSINAVSDSLAQIDTVASAASDVSIVSGSIVNINSVAGSLSNVNTVATSVEDVNSVATNIASVVAVNTNAANIDAVSADLANVGTVASNIASVNSAATNMAAILDAPTQAGNAAIYAGNASTYAGNASTHAGNASTYAGNASTAAGNASTYAGNAWNSKEAALQSKNDAYDAQIKAEAAQALAELARDNVFAVSTIYPDTATALAVVAEGDYFSIPASGDIYMQLYRKVSGAAVFINQFYGTAKIDQIETTQTITAFVQAAAISHIQANLASTLVFP